LPAARFGRYIALAEGNERRAADIYRCNTEISQGLYVFLQAWELTLRNRLDLFLRQEFGAAWPFDPRLRRELQKSPARKLDNAIKKQGRVRGAQLVSTDNVVADLSAGFWVSLLAAHADVPFAWRRNIARIFPHPGVSDRRRAWDMCDGILKLRNRVAHHEPVLHMAPYRRYLDLRTCVASMCPATQAFYAQFCTFEAVHDRWWPARP
jgi:hypothetical protein